MTRRIGQTLLLVAVVGACGRPAAAQTGRPAPTVPVNPYLMGPYANPYLNPALTQYPTSRDAALLYLLGAQRASGGVGSGALGGPGAARPAPAAEMPGSLMVPGGGAARYFQRGA